MSQVQLHSIPYGSQTLDFRLKRSNRKTLAIHVHPDMFIEVVAPQKAELDKVYKKIKKRARWVKKQQVFFSQFHPKTPTREYVPGETHLYMGRQYRLKVVLSVKKEVRRTGGFLVVHSHYPRNPQVTKNLLEEWLLAQAHRKLKERLEVCIKKFPQSEKFIPKSLIIRHLSNRWGSMTPAKRLVLNRHLIHAPVACIDYVIIHELCHMQYANHGAKFWQLLSSILPDWEKRKLQLEKNLS